jgi:hypothetical protein
MTTRGVGRTPGFSPPFRDDNRALVISILRLSIGESRKLQKLLDFRVLGSDADDGKREIEICFFVTL